MYSPVNQWADEPHPVYYKLARRDRVKKGRGVVKNDHWSMVSETEYLQRPAIGVVQYGERHVDPGRELLRRR